MPRNRSSSGRYYAWASIIKRLRATPGRWALELPNAPVRAAVSVRARRHPDLRVPDGRLEADVRHEYVDQNGTKRGDIYLRFVVYNLEPDIDLPPSGGQKE